MESILFSIAAVFTLAFAIGVIVAQTPLRSALSLIGCLLGIATLYFMLSAPFVGALQILVYAGAIMVLFIFVIMTVDFDSMPKIYHSGFSILRSIGIIGVGYICFQLAVSVDITAKSPVDGSITAIGNSLLLSNIYLFEAVSVLLLVAIVAAVVVAMRRN